MAGKRGLYQNCWAVVEVAQLAKVPIMHARGPDFDLWNPCKTLDMLTHACNLHAKDAETDGSLKFSGQLS